MSLPPWLCSCSSPRPEVFTPSSNHRPSLDRNPTHSSRFKYKSLPPPRTYPSLSQVETASNFSEPPHERVWKFIKQSLTFHLGYAYSNSCLSCTAKPGSLRWITFCLSLFTPCLQSVFNKNFVQTSDKECNLKPFLLIDFSNHKET